jgi:O-antigen/teichoic acid export membrane protein
MSGGRERTTAGGAASAPATRALVGTKWVTLGALLQRALQMAAVVVLARLLAPSDFGVFAVVSVAIDALNTFKDFGMPTALIRLRGGVPQSATTLFYLSVASAGLICCGTWLAAPWFAAFVGSPLVTPVLRAVAFKTLFESCSIVQRTLTVRELSVGRVTAVAILEAAVASCLAIVLAAAGLGVWALVWGSLVASALSALVWWRLSPWRPSGRPAAGVARQLITFGAGVSGSWAIENVIDALTRALVGRWRGVVGLGYHDLALRLAVVPIRSVTLAVGQYVAIPAMCLVQRDTRRLASWYLAAMRALSATTAPLAVCLVALPDLVVVAVCGRRWAEAAPLVQVLGPMVFLMPLLYARPVYVATGRVDLLLKISLLQLALTAPAVALAARLSLQAVCLVQIGVCAVVAAVNVTVARRLLGLRWGAIASALCLPLEGVVIQTLVLVGLRAWLRPEPTLWTLAALATPSLLAYALVLRARQPELVAALVGALKRASGLGASGAAPDGWDTAPDPGREG